MVLDKAKGFTAKLAHRLNVPSGDPYRTQARQLFDPNFYRITNPGVYTLSNYELFNHFMEKGGIQGCDPNAEFSSRAYLMMNPDVVRANYNPFLHFLRYGEIENRTARMSSWARTIADPIEDTYSVNDLEAILPQFDAKFYRAQNPELAQLSPRALAAHFMVVGWREGRDPSYEFSIGDYLAMNPDIARAGLNPLLHYALFGEKEGRSSRQTKKISAKGGPASSDMEVVAEFFDADYYRQFNEDVDGDDHALLTHYMQTGWKEGRDPGPEFSTRFYLDEYPDIAAGGLNPLLHYAIFGKKEGRKPRSDGAVALIRSHTADLVPDNLASVMSLDPALENRDVSPPETVNRAAMDIHWVIPDFATGGGGHMTIFRMIHHLEAFGHRCTIWIDAPNQHETPAEAYETIVKNFQCVGAEIRFLSDGFGTATGDALIATAWSTAYHVNSAKGFVAKYYFVQDHEPEFYATGTESVLARASYDFDLACICASPWLEQIMQERYGRWARGFYLACDHNIYRVQDETAHKARFHKDVGGPFKIAVYARDHSPRRCVPLAMIALQILSQSRDDFEVQFFGQDQLPFGQATFAAQNHGVLGAEKLAALYNDCHLGICFSATNYSLVPQEMMACGLPVIELNTESTRAVFPDGVATLAGPSPWDIAAAIGHILDKPRNRSKQAKTAREWVEDLSWKSVARRVETAITDYIDETSTPPAPDVITSRETEIDVVIPTYNGMGELEPVIEALRSQIRADRLQIHCIDSSSSDGTTQWLRKQKDIALSVIDQKDFQHGRTRNVGASQGSAPLIAFLTQDAKPATEFWSSDICQMFAHFPEAAGLFGRHLPYPHHSKFVREQITKHFANFLNLPLALSRYTDPDRWEKGDTGWRQTLHFYSDNNSAMRRNIWEEIPYPEVDYGEDQLWARAIIEAGHTKLYAPTATVYHSHDYDPEETHKRSKIESSFFFTHFGYRLGAGSDEEIAARIKAEQQQMRLWAHRNGLSPDEAELLEANVQARHHGWRDGLRDAEAAG